jgi:hypothetical protein
MVVVRKRPRRVKRRQLAAAQIMSAPKQFNTIKTTGTTAVVTGCDLVYQIPDSLSTEFQNSQVITIIPCNPSYWSGTRVAAVAAGYQNYRPLRFEVIYVPQCAVTQQGNVIGGTLWNQAPSTENLQQTLKTSNGGMLTQCYSKMNSIVKMGNNLQYNLFRMGGAIDQESNPFIFIALGIATTDSNNNRIVPGYFYVRYTYQFKNPIGTGIEFKNSQLINISSKESYLLNSVLYLCEPIRTSNGLTIPTGARIDIEYNNNPEQPGYIYLYNGTEIDLALLRAVWVLENQPFSITTQLNSRKAEIVEIKYNTTQDTGEDVAVNVPPSQGISYTSSQTPNSWTTFINTSPWNSVYVPTEQNQEIYRIIDTLQDFGKVTSINNEGVVKFIIDKALSKLVPTIVKKPTKLLINTDSSV